MRPLCPMLAYFSYVALKFCLALMFFLGRLCGVHHNIYLKARSRNVLFLATFGVRRWECLGKARKGDDAPPASIDSAKLGLPPSAGAALLQFASSALANPAAMPGLLEGPAG
jgi:hypothetical protein